ncbi:MAG: SPFH domain-containing protein [Candidatus Borkfalkiaceae bacterium]|nr:SPFH domain-containing protein [Clostridia bacterium]MDY6223338.1 SPFH domain-containing protein [Christensenellaceae bacterium]
MALLKIIEWADNSSNTLVYKIDTKKNVIKRGSALTVREGQVAIFCDKGRMADVFLPGYYKLETDSLPILTSLLSWKYGFESPFKSEVYFVNTTRFSKQRWGTANPIMLRDPDFGAVRVRAYGTYSFRVKDAFVFMTELSGSHSTFKTEDITDHIRSILVMAISDAMGESGVSVVDMAANLMELSQTVKESLEKRFGEMGLELSDFNFENVSLPAELEKAMDENARLGMFRRNVDVYTQMAQADALKDAAKNPGMAGSTMSAGIGLGMGAQMMRSMNAAYGANGMGGVGAGAAQTKPCPKCGTQVDSGARFCPKCGEKMQAQNVCSKCGAPLAPGAKFCSECGAPTVSVCAKCGAKLALNAKFCPECGEKVK